MSAGNDRAGDSMSFIQPIASTVGRIWGNDGLYDIVVVLDFNFERPKPGAGSAIFFHIATPDFAPTTGCVAVRLNDMRRILARSGPGTWLNVG